MFLLSAIVRFGKAALIFLLIVGIIWVVYRGVSFVVRWLLDQIGVETKEIKNWFAAKLPKRKKKILINTNKSFDQMSDEEIEEIKKLIERMKEELTNGE